MALVLLPCDLPFWPACQRELNALRSARSGPELKHGLLRIYNLCNTSLEPEEFECGADQTVFDLLAQLVDDGDSFSPSERCTFFNIQLPTMIDFALQLKSLKPTRGLHFSLQQQSDRVELDRRLAASLTAHAFFSTFPRRTIKTHPTLQDFNFAGHFFQHLHRRQQRSKLRSILHYFQRLSERPLPPGHVTFARQVMSGREWCTLDEWLQCRLPLCPLVVRHEGRLEAQEANAGAAAVRVCFASAKIGGAFLGDDATSQECAVFSSHPELLSLLPFTESLEDNEAISASGLANYSIIHDDPPAVGGGGGGSGRDVEGNKAVSHPGARQTHNNNNSNSSSNGPTSSSSAISNSPLQQQTVMCLIDAEDYSDLPIRQYEEDNVLRELNKAFVGFKQTPVMAKQQQQQMEHRLPPVGASRDSSPSSRTIATPPQQLQQQTNQDNDDLTRSETLVEEEEEEQKQLHEPTLLYGGGRNAPLTLTKATVIKQLKDGRPPSLAHQHRSVGGGSQYASCDSQSDEFRSANTSVDLPDDTQSLLLVHRRQSTQDGHRQDSSDSNVSADSDRPGSRGFALEGQGVSEEDSFSGDGLERERQWLKEFRERRGGPRSSTNSRSSSSPSAGSSSSGSKDSSRYSFSTEFSSELDELYDQFSHWLEEPGTNGESGSGANGRNAAVFRFAHSLLKRALSDSFASVAMNIENLSSRPEARMKDIKLSSNGGGQCRKDKGQQKRSWSLADHMGDERLALQLAKEMIMEQEMEQVHPMPEPVTAAETADTNSGGDEADEESDGGGGGQKKKTATTSARPSVSITVEQNLAEVELELQVSVTTSASIRPHFTPSLTRQPSFRPIGLRSQASVAWEYHQDPSWTFTIRLMDGGRSMRILRQASTQSYAHHLGQSAALLRRQLTIGRPTNCTISTNPSPSPSCAPPLPELRNDQFFVIPRGPVPVRLLDRMSPVHDDAFTPQPLATCNESSTRGSSQAGDADSDYQQLPPAPMNPTPPRTRRGSWIFKKSREQRHLNPGGIKHQRARSNSVPTVMDLTQLTLWQQQLAEKQQQRGFIPPDIIVSGEDSNAEDEDGKDQQQRRHRSYDDQLQNFAQSNESLLSDDVVEGFSWTMAETIIEDILKDIGSKQAQLCLPKRSHYGGKQDPSSAIPSTSLAASKRKPGKSILKISSNDSLNRSHSGSLEMTRTGSDGPPSPLVFSAVGPSSNGGGADKSVGGGGGCSSAGISEHHQQQMSWSQRSTSMPSLRAIDELGSFNRLSSSSSRSPTADGASQKMDESSNNDGDDADGRRMLPIITGNWGCGSSAAGDAQLKSMIQWMAASRSGAPSLIYFTAGSSTVVKLDIVCRVIMDRQWTVGDLAGAVLRYCRCRLDPRRLNLIVAASSSPSNFGADVGATSLSSPTDPHRLLFDELLGPLKQTEL